MAGRAYGFIEHLSVTGRAPARRRRGSRSPPPEPCSNSCSNRLHGTPGHRQRRQGRVGAGSGRRSEPSGLGSRARRRAVSRCQQAPRRRPGRATRASDRQHDEQRGRADAQDGAACRRAISTISRDERDAAPSRGPSRKNISSTTASSATTTNITTATGTNAGGSTRAGVGAPGSPGVHQLVLEDDREHRRDARSGDQRPRSARSPPSPIVGRSGSSVSSSSPVVDPGAARCPRVSHHEHRTPDDHPVPRRPRAPRRHR